MSFQTWDWQGASGAWFLHTIYPFTDRLPFDNVNYVFARRNLNGTVTPLYIGQTEDGSTRFPTHEKFKPARALGANELHIHFGSGTRSRLDIETDLRRGHWTPLNDQPTPAPAPIAGVADPLAALLAFGPTIPPKRVLGLEPISVLNEGVAGSPFGSLAPDFGYSPLNAGVKRPVSDRNRVLAALLRLE